MPIVDSSQSTSSAARAWVASTAASWSATRDDGQRHQPEERAAVGDDEQDRHDGCRGGEQAEVRAVEHGGEVGLDGRRAGDLRGHALGEVRRRGGAQVGDDVGRLDGILGGDRDDDRCGRAVLGHHGGCAGGSGQGAGLLLHRGERVGGEGLVAAVEHHGRRAPPPRAAGRAARRPPGCPCRSAGPRCRWPATPPARPAR